MDVETQVRANKRNFSICAHSKLHVRLINHTINVSIFQFLAQEKADAIIKSVAYPDWLTSDEELDKYYEGVNMFWYFIFNKSCIKTALIWITSYIVSSLKDHATSC